MPGSLPRNFLFFAELPLNENSDAFRKFGRFRAAQGNHLRTGEAGRSEGVFFAIQVHRVDDLAIEHALIEFFVSGVGVLPVMLAIEVRARLAGVADAMDDREVTGAFLTVEFLTVENLHHRLEPGVELCKPVAKVECLVFAQEQGGAVGSIVFIVASRDYGVNAVIAAALEDEKHLLFARMIVCQNVGW